MIGRVETIAKSLLDEQELYSMDNQADKLVNDNEIIWPLKITLFPIFG